MVEIQANFKLTKHPNTACITIYLHLQVVELAFPFSGSGSFTTLTFYVHIHTHKSCQKRGHSDERDQRWITDQRKKKGMKEGKQKGIEQQGEGNRDK